MDININKFEIKNKIDELKYNSQKSKKIFELIVKNKYFYSTSKNGIFIDVSIIDNDILKQINNILNE